MMILHEHFNGYNVFHDTLANKLLVIWVHVLAVCFAVELLLFWNEILG